VAIFPFQVCAGSSGEGIVERYVQCAQSPMHFVESAAPVWQQSVALFNELLGTEINKQL